VSWIFSSTPYYSATEIDKILTRNPVEFGLLEGQPEINEYKCNNLEDKVVFRKKFGDPRVVQYHKFQLTYSKMPKIGVDIINSYMRFFGQTIYLKLWQFDAKYDAVSADVTGAVECWPIGDGTFYNYFAPYRNLASDETALTKVWVDGVLQTTGYTIDYSEGKITFTTEQSEYSKVMMHFVWKPKVSIINLDPRPLAGQKYSEPRYAPVVILKEV
jgi:hypothetical protein